MTRPFWGLLPWLLAVAAAAALAWQTDRASDLLGASKRLRVAEVMSREMSRTGRAPRELVAGNLRLLREARRLDSAEVGIPVALAGQYMLLDRPETAIEIYREALELEPRPETYLNLGNALLAAGSRDEAREAFELAVRLAPRLRRDVPRDMVPPGRRALRKASPAP